LMGTVMPAVGLLLVAVGLDRGQRSRSRRRALITQFQPRKNQAARKRASLWPCANSPPHNAIERCSQLFPPSDKGFPPTTKAVAGISAFQQSLECFAMRWDVMHLHFLAFQSLQETFNREEAHPVNSPCFFEEALSCRDDRKLAKHIQDTMCQHLMLTYHP
jgi:hypothetical protein